MGGKVYKKQYLASQFTCGRVKAASEAAVSCRPRGGMVCVAPLRSLPALSHLTPIQGLCLLIFFTVPEKERKEISVEIILIKFVRMSGLCVGRRRMLSKAVEVKVLVRYSET